MICNRLWGVYHQKTKNAKSWATKYIVGLFIFNILIAILLLLHSAGYFYPFFTITINLIVLFCLISSIFLLGVRDKVLFLFSFIFWIFAASLKILYIDIWAERTTVYAFESLVVGILILIVENFNLKDK
jgi:hypothetical protein